MKIISIKINNILSIEDAIVTFDNNGLMLIEGWDYDNGRANGAGKTAIFNALSFALYDKLPRKITATEIVRRGCKLGSAEVTFEANGMRHMVKRSRPKGFTYQRGTNTSLDTVSITQEELETSVYKLNYKQFTMTAYNSQGSSNRFLSVNDADKKVFLLQLLNLAEFAAGKNLADENAKNLQKELDTSLSKVQNIDSKISAYSESLEDEDSLQLQLDTSNSSITNIINTVQQLQAVSKPDLSKYQKLEDDILSKKTEITRIKARKEILHEQYRKLKAKQTPFQGSETCSTCRSKLDILSAKTAHQEELDKGLVEIAEIKAQIDICDTALIKEAQVNEFHSKLKDKKKLESNDYEIASGKVIELKSKLALKQQEVKGLLIKLQNNAELSNKIKVLEQLRTQVASTQAGFKSKIELYKTVSAIYSPTGAQAYILDSVIESFNERMQEYVNILWSNMTYELKSYKENVSGDVSAKFSELLMMDNKEISIGSLSGGEYRALSLCVDFALTDVMERQFGVSISPVVLDEPYEGLDATGKELITNLLVSLASDKMIIVVDHSSETVAMFSKVLRVEKRNGISSITKSKEV